MQIVDSRIFGVLINHDREHQVRRMRKGTADAGRTRTSRMRETNPAADLALAGALRRLRSERGISQEEIAFRAQMTTEAYQRVELSQTVPSWTAVRAICAALGATLHELADAVEGATA